MGKVGAGARTVVAAVSVVVATTLGQVMAKLGNGSIMQVLP